jgi:hypothetical protein
MQSTVKLAKKRRRTAAPVVTAGEFSVLTAAEYAEFIDSQEMPEGQVQADDFIGTSPEI